MADYFRFHLAWLKQAERLSESERGRLLAGIAEYSQTGILPEFRGNERYLFPLLSPAPDAPEKTEQTHALPPQPKPKRARAAFVPPTLEEVKAYIEENKYTVDAQKFISYFQASGWVDSTGKPVLNWKQKIITWNGRTQYDNKSKSPQVGRKGFQIDQNAKTDEELSYLLVDLDKDIE